MECHTYDDFLRMKLPDDAQLIEINVNENLVQINRSLNQNSIQAGLEKATIVIDRKSSIPPVIKIS